MPPGHWPVSNVGYRSGLYTHGQAAGVDEIGQDLAIPNKGICKKIRTSPQDPRGGKNVYIYIHIYIYTFVSVFTSQTHVYIYIYSPANRLKLSYLSLHEKPF